MTLRIALTLLSVCGFVLSLPAHAQQGKFTTFDAPGAQFPLGTYPTAINAAGAITGTFHTALPFADHGFVRTPKGTLISFDVPDSSITVPSSINPAGVITGQYFDASFVAHGFLRAVDGTITAFDLPGTPLGTPTMQPINPAGVIAGTYADANFVWHGFLRTPDGTITTIDAPGAGAIPGSYFGTVAVGINPKGTISGCYTDANSVFHGFVRARGGEITSFDVPGSGTGQFQGVVCAFTLLDPGLAINPRGDITGAYIDGDNVLHGFIRSSGGAFTRFDLPGGGSPVPQGITPNGAVTGYFTDANGVSHGFLRSPDGRVTILDAPGAGTGLFQGTLPRAIDEAGQVTGHYGDANGLNHGFLWIPPFNCH